MAVVHALNRSVAWLLSFTVAILPLHGLAQDASSVGRQGQTFGTSEAAELLEEFPDISRGRVYLPDGESVALDQLIPTDQRMGGSIQGQDGALPNPSQSESQSGSDSSLNTIGNQSHQILDASNSSLTGIAYDLVKGTRERDRPSFYNDPMMQGSYDTYGDMDVIAAGFGDCEVDQEWNSTSGSTHVRDIQTCLRIQDKTAECTVEHDYTVTPVVSHYDGPYNIDSCDGDESCVNVWIGEVGNNYYKGYCKIFEQQTSVRVDNPGAITKVTLEYAKYDDYMQVWIGNNKIWQGPDDNFPPETGGQCELDTSWEQNLNVDVTEHFKNAEVGEVLNFRMRVSVYDEGEGYARLRINYNPNLVLDDGDWTPPECIESAVGIEDGFADGTMECIDSPVLDDNGCALINGVTICESDFNSRPLQTVSPFCRELNVDADYEFWRGQMECWTDPQGEEHCPYNEGENLDSCIAMEDDPGCGFISQECVQYAEGDSGYCYLFEERYDCGTSQPLNGVDTSTEYTCGGAIRCMGDDCIDVNKTESDDFGQAAALLHAAQFMTEDMTCTGVDDSGYPIGDENVTCSVFAGDSGECKIAVGGVQDCCEKPTNVGVGDYLTMVMQTPKIDAAVMRLGDSNAVGGAYQTLREPIMDSWQTLTEPFTSYMESIGGLTETSTEAAASGIKDQLVAELRDQLQELVYDMVVENGATEAAATAAADQAVQYFELGGQAMGVISTVYTVYVIAQIMIQVIWECEAEEFETNAHRAMGNCTYVGSYCKTEVIGTCIEKREAYCCYNSPLSRIINEQALPQLGLNYGIPDNPVCGGIPIQRVKDIDWSRINLNEWVSMLQQNGQFPMPGNVNIESLTGMDSELDTYNPENSDSSPRQNAVERAEQRIQDIDLETKLGEGTEMAADSLESQYGTF